MTKHMEKAERSNNPGSDAAAEYLSDPTTDQLLSTATQLCLLYLEYEKLLKKQKALFKDDPKDGF